MPWSKKIIENHKKTSARLEKIKNEAFGFIKSHPDATEYQVQQFVRKLFSKNNLKLAEHSPIVAFGRNTSEVHHFSTSDIQHPTSNFPILIDLWSAAKTKNSPFADITWMGFYPPKFSAGKFGRVNGYQIPKEFQKIFNLVIKSRDTCLKHLAKKLKKKIIPSGFELDKIARDVIAKAGFGKNFPHSTGHSLGFTSPHGKEAGLSFKNRGPLQKNLGYTIEPGIYLKNKFGVRSEIDFYITDSFKLVIAGKIQKGIIKLV